MSKRSNLEPIHISCVDRSRSTIQSKIQYQLCRMVKLHRKKFFVSLWVLGKRIAPKYYFDSIRMRMNGRGRKNFLKQYICIELLNTSICSPKHPFVEFNNKAKDSMIVQMGAKTNELSACKHYKQPTNISYVLE